MERFDESTSNNENTRYSIGGLWLGFVFRTSARGVKEKPFREVMTLHEWNMAVIRE